MIVGIGVDLCVVERFQAMLERRPGLAERLLTPREQELSVQSKAARFAAKEALAKALHSPGGLRWLDAEVVKDPAGVPSFALSGTVADRVSELGITRIHLSLSHDGGFATAMVVCES
ncbi:holo-ACP synthase [Arachnia propionica]|uniref:Holo-[acyl-carrier-protein] synthase n=1 Tax=Arachnia propionica TaxID=1750 RepID=A0A3P1TB85_9ACTN|nr:holo-ACP synthase [Arachnia propionica]MDO5082148.1 holo-ACP synthase [Arachnia propionica]RRD06692.1 holo-ACP synthase [Arachnia propionica]